MNELKFWLLIYNSVNKGLNSILMIVTESSHSSPGKKGFKMIITEDGNKVGTIGGGIMEKNMIQHASEMLSQKKKFDFKILYHSNEAVEEKSGLICGGYQKILFRLLDESDLNIIKSIIECYENNKYADLVIAENEFKILELNHFEKISDDDKIYIEKIGRIDTAYIIGAGHVGTAISQVLSLIGFRVFLFDNRNEIFDLMKDAQADKKIVTSYDNISDFINKGENSYIIIVTHNIVDDTTALKSVINKNVKYIGLMGSKRKIKNIFDELTNSGVKKEDLDKIHTPIGLEINANTPIEIAISVASEIIKVKNEKD